MTGNQSQHHPLQKVLKVIKDINDPDDFNNFID